MLVPVTFPVMEILPIRLPAVMLPVVVMELEPSAASNDVTSEFEYVAGSPVN